MTPYILIVDDDPDARALLELVLKRQNVETRSAASGTEALKAIHAEKPRVILLDLDLPDMSGYDLLAELSASAGARRIPAIVITAIRPPYEYAQLRQAGVVRVLRKGQFSIGDLSNLVSDLIGPTTQPGWQPGLFSVT